MADELTAFTRLGYLTHKIGDPYGYPGSVWNQGEYAYLNTTVTNTTGRVLRDADVWIAVYGAAQIAPIKAWGLTWYDGEEYRAELEPGQSVLIHTRLRATSAGRVHITLRASAEVVNSGSRFLRHKHDINTTPV